MFVKEFKKFAYKSLMFSYYIITEIIMQDFIYPYYAFSFGKIVKENSVIF